MSKEESGGKRYTQSELEALVAFEVSKQRVDNVERRQDVLQESMRESFTRLEAGMTAMERGLQAHSEHVDRCRDQIRDEIARDFVDREAFHSMDVKVNSIDAKVDRLWVKVTTAVTVVMVIANIVLHFWDAYSKATGSG